MAISNVEFFETKNLHLFNPLQRKIELYPHAISLTKFFNMSHFDHDSTPSSNSAVYWVCWIFTFVCSHASGVGYIIAGAIPEVTIPTHDVRYLPQLQELIPALILALACGLVSFIANKIFNIIYNKLFPQKHAKNS